MPLRPSKSYRDDFPEQSETSQGQTTPTQFGDACEDDQPTPMRAHFALHEAEEEEDSEEGEAQDDDRDSLDDDEFESHYSQQESAASSEEQDDEEDEDEDEDEDVIEMSPTRSRFIAHGEPLQRVSSLPLGNVSSNHTAQLHMSHSTTSLPRATPPLPPPLLYPPFYNRPPTPLPPSPSLTSLLRPPSLLNRSTTSTRPTTPDSSDLETPATNDDAEAAVASSARRANPLPPTAPKVPTYEYYGFVLYLASTLAFLLYLMWAYLPSPFLRAMGITYYPNRWWALAVPAWIVMLLVYIYVALACVNTEYLTLRLQQIETMVDEAGSVAILDEHGRVRKGGSKRFETELQQKLQGDKGGTGWTKRKASGSSNHAKKKDRRRKERDSDKDGDWRFGYTGDIVDGMLANGLTWQQIWNEGTDAVMDVPIGGVCEVLYGHEDLAEF